MKMFFKLNSAIVKLFLYVSTASLAALLADLQHIFCSTTGDFKISGLKISIVVINFVLQGLIAWRAFIDDAAQKEVDSPHHLTENIKK
jgi:NADH:ubiquinone oxidoreductase subunit 4 (subunit M)